MSAVRAILRLSVVAALVAVCLVAVGAGPVSAAVPCQRTYSDSVPQPIQDTGQLLMRTIDDPEAGLVIDVDVTLNIHYDAPQDLAIDLKSSPDDDSFNLTTRIYQGEQRFAGAHMLGTTFDDEAAAPISWRDAADPGRFLPTRRLSDVEGLAGGKFILLIANIGNSGTGTLDNWSITVTYQTCDFDSDGVEDHGDQCLQISAATATGCPLTTRGLTAKYKLGKFKGALASPVAGTHRDDLEAAKRRGSPGRHGHHPFRRHLQADPGEEGRQVLRDLASGGGDRRRRVPGGEVGGLQDPLTVRDARNARCPAA